MDACLSSPLLPSRLLPPSKLANGNLSSCHPLSVDCPSSPFAFSRLPFNSPCLESPAPLTVAMSQTTPTKAAKAAAAKALKVAKAGAQAGAPSGFAIQPADPIDLVNAAHLAQVQQAMDQVLAHPSFAGVVSEDPLPLGQSSIAPFAKADYDLGMLQGKYACGFNLFKLSLTFSACPGVPINRTGARS